MHLHDPLHDWRDRTRDIGLAPLGLVVVPLPPLGEIRVGERLVDMGVQINDGQAEERRGSPFKLGIG